MELIYNQSVAWRGGKVAGDARESTEKELGRSVVSSKNNLNARQLEIENLDEEI